MSEWISVDDQLPCFPARVLVKTTVIGMCVASITRDNEGMFVCWGVINDIDLEQDQVTHWMPLPEPPK